MIPKIKIVRFPYLSNREKIMLEPINFEEAKRFIKKEKEKIAMLVFSDFIKNHSFMPKVNKRDPEQPYFGTIDDIIKQKEIRREREKELQEKGEWEKRDTSWVNKGPIDSLKAHKYVDWM